MHTKLSFRGQPLSVAEMVDRLRGEFAFVAVDADEGVAAAQRVVELWNRPPPLFADVPGAHEKAEYYRGLAPGGVVVISFGDDPSRSVTTTLWPREAPFFGSNPDHDDEAAEGLIERCARVLECEVTTA